MSGAGSVSVADVSKSFLLPHEQHSSLKQAALNAFRKPRLETYDVLREVSFEVASGEFFGIIGRNGSGKSTLLKILAGIYVASSGRVVVRGRIAPFVELGVGFHPELSGRDNVFLNGAIFGLSPSALRARYDDIVAYAELEQFMDQRLKNYSTGMQVRLAFSIAIQADADVIIMDEVLAVGDAAFQQKCYETFRQLKAAGRTIILVTHDMGSIESFCDRALVLERGLSHGVMPAVEAAAKYRELNHQPAAGPLHDVSTGSGGLTIDVSAPGDGGIVPGAELTVRLERTGSSDGTGGLRVHILQASGAVLTTASTEGEPDLAPLTGVRVSFPHLALPPGQYLVRAEAVDGGGTIVDTGVAEFVVAVPPGRPAGEQLLDLPHRWTPAPG